MSCHPTNISSTPETIVFFEIKYQFRGSINTNNLSGQAVSVLEEEYLSAAIHRATLNAKNMPSGLYFVRLNADNQTFTRKVMLIR